MIEIDPYDHINKGDIVEITSSTGVKQLRRWEGVDDIGRATWKIKDGYVSYPSEKFNVRLVCRKENEEKS